MSNINKSKSSNANLHDVGDSYYLRCRYGKCDVEFIMSRLMKIGLLKRKFFFVVKEFSVINFNFKNACSNKFQGNNENRVADQEIEFLTKSILMP